MVSFFQVMLDDAKILQSLRALVLLIKFPLIVKR